MEQQTIRLHPFEDRTAAQLDITCTIGRQSHLLKIDFRLQGDLKAVAIPPLAKRPARRHQLWENTCLECFVAAEVSPAYWEFNLSPAGNWNAYRFDDYRQGMREEKVVMGTFYKPRFSEMNLKFVDSAACIAYNV